MNKLFVVCKHCGNLAIPVVDSGVPMMCCGEAMQEAVPNTVDASQEKHLPAVTVEGGVVSVAVGSVPHPMEEAHHITVVYLETKNGGQCKRLAVGATPQASFSVVDDEPVAVYAHCNLHGLWKTPLCVVI
ncbi:MAG: desulfoferrodoxin [Kiritimatiellaeota bacterium]|nr:desulfoferrodoxin [Kiritimatiellota bacterium]